MKNMMLASIACSSILAGCSNSVPACSDERTVKLLKEIIHDEGVRRVGPERGNLYTYELNAIRTRSTNEQTGAHECAADLTNIHSERGVTREVSITYTVENVDSEEQLYVTVYGL